MAMTILARSRPTGRTAAVVVTVLAAPVIGAVTAARPILGMLATGALVVGVVSALAPQVAVLIATVLIWSNAVAVAVSFHGAPTVVGIVVPALLAIPVVGHLLRRDRLLSTVGMWWLLAYGLVLVVGVSQAVDRGLAVQSLIVFVTEGLLLFLLVVNGVRTADLLRRILWALLLVGVVLSALSVVQTVTGSWSEDRLGFAQVSLVKLEQLADDPFDEHAEPRAGGPFAKENRYAQVLVVLVPIGLVLARRSDRRRDRLLAAAAATVILAGLALTYSRGALVALLVTAIVMVLIGELELRYLVLIGVVAVLASGALPRWGDRIASATALMDSGTSETDGSVRGRLSSTLGSALVFLDNPWLGVGLGNYPIHHYDAALELGIRVEESRQPHSLYPQIAAESGIFGLSAFLGAVAVTGRALLRVARRRDEDAVVARAVGLALVTYLATGVFLHLAYERYFWFLLALAAVAGRGGAPSPDGVSDEPPAALVVIPEPVLAARP
jgi:putative inorganic carbon (HCO3(-)) transporter